MAELLSRTQTVDTETYVAKFHRYVGYLGYFALLYILNWLYTEVPKLFKCKTETDAKLDVAADKIDGFASTDVKKKRFAYE